MTTKPQSRIQRGKFLENYVAQEIRGKRLDPMAMRQIGSGSGKWKGDINTKMKILHQQAVIEVKNQKKIKLPEWWTQVDRDTLKNYGEPVLVFKFDRKPLDTALATVYLDTLLELIKLARIGQQVTLNEIR